MRRILTQLMLSLAAAAQPTLDESALAEAKKLTVMISSTVGDRQMLGAGIIVALENDRVYIVTANHLLRAGAQQARNGDVQVEFSWLRGEQFEPKILNEFDDRALDLAVLTVPNLASTRALTQGLRFDRIAPAGQPRQRSTVWALGYPSGYKWQLSPSAELAQIDAVTLRAGSGTALAAGYSGGPLLADKGNVIGMVRRDFEATRANLILDQVRQWSLPVGSTPGNPPVASTESVSFGEVLRRVIETAPDDFKAIKIPFIGRAFGPWNPRLSLPGSQRCDIDLLGYHCRFTPSALADPSGERERLRILVRAILPSIWQLTSNENRDLFVGPNGVNVEIDNYDKSSIGLHVKRVYR